MSKVSSYLQQSCGSQIREFGESRWPGNPLPPPPAVEVPLGDMEAGELIVQGQPELHGKFQHSLGYAVRFLSLKEQVHGFGFYWEILIGGR